MIIYCCNCEAEIDARLTDGSEIYPHREDLESLPFWKCDGCGSYVGCHHKSTNRTKPLGVIPSGRIKEYRRFIHARLDPIWKTKRESRRYLYAELSKVLGRQYHTAELRTEEECALILDYLIEKYC